VYVTTSVSWDCALQVQFCNVSINRPLYVQIYNCFLHRVSSDPMAAKNATAAMCRMTLILANWLANDVSYKNEIQVGTEYIRIIIIATVVIEDSLYRLARVFTNDV
jgi:hypothetical protein